MPETTRTRIGTAYEILGELGRGGMATVFKARQTRLDRIVALKLLSTDLTADPDSAERFKRQAQAGARLEHDHIVQTHDWGVFNGQPYVAMTFIEGETLSARISRDGALSPEDTVRFIAPIADALAYAHERGIIHRDVTTGNIMIRAEDERPFLIDFGIAQAAFFTRRLTQRREVLGTPEFMSPEQARADEIDARSDLYSLGVVLYECLTGRLPFQSPHTEVLLSNIKTEPHRSVHHVNPQVPVWLSEVVDRCLAKHPDNRYPDAAALAAALRSGLAKVATPAANRRRPVLALLLLLSVAGAGYGMFAGWFDGDGAERQPAAFSADTLAADSLMGEPGDSVRALPQPTRLKPAPLEPIVPASRETPDAPPPDDDGTEAGPPGKLKPEAMGKAKGHDKPKKNSRNGKKKKDSDAAARPGPPRRGW